MTGGPTHFRIATSAARRSRARPHRPGRLARTARVIPSALAVLLFLVAPSFLVTRALAADPARSLPTNLSPIGMFRQADLVVQTVMVGLAAAALLSWIVLLAKRFEIALAARRMRRAALSLSQRADLSDAIGGDRITQALLSAAGDEVKRASDLATRSGVGDRIALRLSRIEAAAAREIALGVSVLATIAATAPFIGLFGTVWGIMNSFISISQSQTTNLAVVAPGIAEALLATAIGLVAAIPAVIFHNHLNRSVIAYRALLGDAVALVAVLASRDLDRAHADR